MAERVAYLLRLVSLENACLLYFLTAPIFLDRQNAVAVLPLFGAGHLLCALILALAGGYALTRLQDRVPLNWIAGLMVLMVLIALFSVAVNTPEKYLQPGWWFTKYLKIILPLGCMLVMTRIWNFRDLPLLYSLIVVLTLLGFMMLLQDVLRSGGVRPGRGMILFDDPNKFAVILNVFYGVMFPKLLDAARRGRPSLGLLIACLAVFAALFVLQTRSGILTCLALSVICVLATRSWRVIRIALLAFLPIVALFAIAITARVSSGNVSESDLGRFLTYLVGFDIVRDRPLLGIGFANVLDAYDQYGGVSLMLLGQPMAIHNATLEIFAEQGVFGAIVYLAATFVPIVLLGRRILASRDRYPVVELAALAIPLTFFCYGLFYHNYLADDHFWVYMAIPLIVIRSRIPEDFELKLPRLRL